MLLEHQEAAPENPPVKWNQWHQIVNVCVNPIHWLIIKSVRIKGVRTNAVIGMKNQDQRSEN